MTMLSAKTAVSSPWMVGAKKGLKQVSSSG
jgi:hypothetical protein